MGLVCVCVFVYVCMANKTRFLSLSSTSDHAPCPSPSSLSPSAEAFVTLPPLLLSSPLVYISVISSRSLLYKHLVFPFSPSLLPFLSILLSQYVMKLRFLCGKNDVGSKNLPPLYGM